MTTTQPQKKGIGGMAIAITIIILLGIGSGIAYAQLIKSTSHEGSDEPAEAENDSLSSGLAPLEQAKKISKQYQRVQKTFDELKKKQGGLTGRDDKVLNSYNSIIENHMKQLEKEHNATNTADNGDVSYSSFYNQI